MPAKYLSKWIWERPEWPEFHWDAARLSPLLAATRKAQAELTGMSRLLDPDSDLQAQLEILTSEGVATSAIEGQRFDANALRSSLARRLGLPTAGLPPAPRTVEGLADVLMDATQRLDNAKTLKRLASWQAALFPTGSFWPEQDPRRAAARGFTDADRLGADRASARALRGAAAARP